MKSLKLLLISLSLVISSLSFTDSSLYNQQGRMLTDADLTEQALLSHNQVRLKDNQRPLIASKDLTQIAKKWVNQLARSCKMSHQKGAPFGENIFWSGGPTNISHAIHAWAGEKKNYNIKQNTCLKGKQCLHYTQLVWAGTTEVGCAKQRCANGSGAEIYVCNYFPAGNIVGARPFKP